MGRGLELRAGLEGRTPLSQLRGRVKSLALTLYSGKMAAVIVHGGSFTIPHHLVDPSVRGCEKAALEAHKVLLEGKSALDAGGSVS